MEILSAKQSAEANRTKRQAMQAAQVPAKRPILAVKPRRDGEWSEARRQAEALFEI